MTVEDEIADTVSGLKAVRADYLTMKAHWLTERRAIVDLVVQHADTVLLQKILDRLEESCEIWDRWPPA
jgi:hypothetical protein